MVRPIRTLATVVTVHDSWTAATNGAAVDDAANYLSLLEEEINRLSNLLHQFMGYEIGTTQVARAVVNLRPSDFAWNGKVKMLARNRRNKREIRNLL